MSHAALSLAKLILYDSLAFLPRFFRSRIPSISVDWRSYSAYDNRGSTHILVTASDRCLTTVLFLVHKSLCHSYNSDTNF